MAFVKKSEEKREYRALVNLSVGRVERGPDGRHESAERVERGKTVFLTEAEASNFGRLVRLVETEKDDKVQTHVSPKQVLGVQEVDKRGAAVDPKSGALDLRNETHVYKELTEAEADELAQPVNNPADPSYRGEEN